MDLGDSPAEARFRAELRDWLHSQIPVAPAGGPPGAEALPPRQWSRLLHEAGYAGLTWPIEAGGRGLAPSFAGIFAEECALAGAPDDVNVIGLNMVGPTVVRYATPAQRERHLARILSGEHVFCQGFSEPEAGSDLAAVATVAERTPEGFVLNGEKLWSSYAHLADYCLLLARSDPHAARHHGLTCFVVDMRTPGVSVRPLRQLTGDTDFGHIALDDVRVPPDGVIGEVGNGWRVAMTTLAHERGTFGITLTARLSVQFDRLLQTVRAADRAKDPVVRASVAELYIELQALRFTGYRALGTLLHTGEPGAESTVLKLQWSHTHQRLTAVALDMLGPDGVLTGETGFWGGYWMHHRLRSRGNTIEGGTSEILRGIIAERVAGLPRSR